MCFLIRALLITRQRFNIFQQSVIYLPIMFISYTLYLYAEFSIMEYNESLLECNKRVRLGFSNVEMIGLH